MTASRQARHARVETTTAAVRHDHHAIASMPDRRKPGAMTSGRLHRVPRATANPVDRPAPAVMIVTRRTIDARSGATTISAGSVQVAQPVAQRAHAMTATGIAGAGHNLRLDVTTIGELPGQALAQRSHVVVARLDRREVAHGQVALVGLGAVQVAVRLASGAVRRRVQADRRADRDEGRVGRGSGHGATIRQVEQEVAVTDRRMTIAIDGPAAAGKSTVGEIVARRIDGVYFDTGLLYRALTLLALERGIAPSDAPNLAALAATMDIQIGRPTIDDGRQVDVLLSGRDVTHSLRTPTIDQNVSAVSAHALVREALLEQQRRIGRSGRVVMVGRDIGTVVLPDAELKVFLDASPEERARRRCLQLDESGRPLPYDVVLADMQRRDRLDSERDVAPLRPADDAVVIDSDALTVKEVADVIVSHAEQRLESAHG